MRARLPRTLLGAVAVLLFSSEALAGQYIVYLHGRGSQTWAHGVTPIAGWTSVTLSYDGNSSLADARSSTSIRNAVRTYCSGDNACIIACYSAGCLRTLHAMDTLRAQGVELRVLWVEATGSAAGGTRLAEISTNLIGDEPIDEDIRRDAARPATGWGHIQDAMPPMVMYHLAGKRDSCVFFLCGNWFLPSGACDGLVCMDSAGGAAKAGEFHDGCALQAAGALYPGRRYDSAQAPCTGLDKNHGQLGSSLSQAVQRGLTLPPRSDPRTAPASSR